jgi:hypothetical protein
MPLYLHLTQGPTPLGARPVLSVHDQRLIAEFLATIGRRGEECAPEADDERSPMPRLRAVGRDAAPVEARR